MAQHMGAAQAIDLDDSFSDTELLPVAPPPLQVVRQSQPSTQPGTASAFAMVAQQTLLPVANTGRRRLRSPSCIIEGHPNPRRAIPRADPGSAAERGRTWVPAPTTAAAAAAVPSAAAAAAAETNMERKWTSRLNLLG